METKHWIETSESLDFVEEYATWDECYARIMELESEMREIGNYKPGSFCITEVEIDATIPGGYDYLDRDYIINAKD